MRNAGRYQRSLTDCAQFLNLLPPLTAQAIESKSGRRALSRPPAAIGCTPITGRRPRYPQGQCRAGLAIIRKDSQMVESSMHVTRSAPCKSALEDSYIAACRNGSIEKTKSEHRTRVLRFMLDNQPPHRCWRFLTNPGPCWTFEKQVEVELGPCHASKSPMKRRGVYFVGIERNWSVLEFGLRHMPGKKVRYEFDEESQQRIAYISPRASVLYGDIEHLPLRFSDSEIRPSFGMPSRFRTVIRPRPHLHFCTGFTGVWHDTFAPIGRTSFAAFLHRLPSMLWRDESFDIPLCFSFLVGRDVIPIGNSGSPLATRCDAIKHQLESDQGQFEIKDAWRYSGLNQAPFATVCGLYRSI